MKKKEIKHYALEVLLVLAGVLIFRSAWTLMDRVAELNTTEALLIMLLIGLIVTIVAFGQLFKHEKEH